MKKSDEASRLPMRPLQGAVDSSEREPVTLPQVPHATVEKAMSRHLGIIGGMGARAGLRLAELLIREAESAGVKKDADFPRFTLYNMLTNAIDERGVSDAKVLQRGISCAIRLLKQIGCDLFVIACNSAHCFMEDFEMQCPGQIVNMIEAGCLEAAKSPGPISVMSSQSTRDMALYQDQLRKLGRTMHPAVSDEQQDVLNNAVANFVQARTPQSGEVERVIQELHSGGAETVILGCTELPMLVRRERLPVHLVDAGECAIKKAFKLLHG